MSAETWLRIVNLFEAALAQPAEQRARFVEENSPGDPEIGQEVLSLLESAVKAGAFLENPSAAWSGRRFTLERGYRLGQFEILEVIGRGGMGDVYRARDLRLKREVAIKVLPPDFARNPERVLRFEREARAVGSLSHPNVLHVYEIGETDGNSWIASELVQGHSLHHVMERGVVPCRRAIEIAIQIAEGLAAAHAAGIIHRDLTPGNIMLTPAGGVKILDFGIAKFDNAISRASGGPGAEITGTGLVMGTPGYMAPEQVVGGTADARSDIFALGVLLYEMHSGTRAFKSASAVETMNATLKDEPPDLPASIPAAVQRITRRCLEKEPAQRFQSAADVAFALAALSNAAMSTASDMRAGHRVSLKWIVVAAAAAIAIAWAGYWMGTRVNRPASAGDFVVRRLTADLGLTTDGALSPDGKLVAFASDRANPDNLDIWVKQLAGAGVAVRLTSDAADDYDPAFSPDGTQIVYRSDRGEGGIYAVPTLGGEPRLLVARGRRPRFSPDGRFLLYRTGMGSRGRPQGDSSVNLFVQALSGGPVMQVGSGCAWLNASAVWSPDSRRVLFEGSCDKQLSVWTFSIDDRHLQPSNRLFEYLRDHDFRSPSSVFQYPAFIFQEWAADPSRLLMSRFAGDTISSVAVPISAYGSRPIGAFQKLTFGAGDEYRVSAASNQRIVLSTATATPQVWGLPIDEYGKAAGDLRQLTFDGSGSPSLSRDGRILAVDSGRADDWEIHSIDLLTHAQNPIDAGPGGIGSHLLSHRGDTIFYVVINDRKFTLLEVPTSGGLPRELREGRFLLEDQSSSARLLLGTTDSKRHGITAFDIETREQREVLVDPGGRWLWQAALSKDDRWVTFIAEWPGNPQIYIAPFRGVLVAKSEWIPVTNGSAWDDKPHFSHNDKLMLFTSDRDGHQCIWAERLRSDMHPLGEPFAVQHFHSSRRSIANTGIGGLRLGVGPRMIVFEQTEFTGNLSLLEPANK